MRRGQPDPIDSAAGLAAAPPVMYGRVPDFSGR
jgi:hypothetical protein